MSSSDHDNKKRKHEQEDRNGLPGKRARQIRSSLDINAHLTTTTYHFIEVTKRSLTCKKVRSSSGTCEEHSKVQDDSLKGITQQASCPDETLEAPTYEDEVQSQQTICGAEGQASSLIDPEDNQWRVESLLARRKKRGVVEYKVKWLGFSELESTWERRQDIDPGCIDEYEEAQRAVSKVKS